MAVTLNDVLQHLGVDELTDTVINANATRALNTAEKILQGAVGEDVRQLMPNDPRVDELVLIYAEDLYSERGVGSKVSNATRRLVYDMELQLRMELRALRDARASRRHRGRRH